VTIAKLSYDERALLASSLEEKRFGNGIRIVVEGEVGHEFFIIKDGRAIVTRINPETKEENELCELKRGMSSSLTTCYC
jgi:CRP-like cAMP-binding protein